MIHIDEDKIEFEGVVKDLLIELTLGYHEFRKKFCRETGMTETNFDEAFTKSLNAIRLLEAGMNIKNVMEVLKI